MLKIFTILANLIVYDWLGLEQGSHFASSLHFFVEDTTKIFALLIVMIFIISYLRASLNIEKVRDYLAGKHRFVGYLIGSSFGAVTPFCSCSSMPLFLGFTQARIPVGITMSFLITSPMINEVAIALLGSLLGIKFMIAYIVVGISAGIIGGFFFDLIKAERFLIGIAADVANNDNDAGAIKHERQKLTHKQRLNFAKNELKSIISRVWKWVFVGIGLGAALHGYVPNELILNTLGDGQWWSVPLASIIGVPLYANASGVIPVAESLLNKGLPVGTTLAFMSSVVAASMPEFIILKQVMKIKLLVIFFVLLVVLFTCSGWLFNILW